MSKSVFQQLVEQTCSTPNFKPSNGKHAKPETRNPKLDPSKSVPDPSAPTATSSASASSAAQNDAHRQKSGSSNGRQSAAPSTTKDAASILKSLIAAAAASANSKPETRNSKLAAADAAARCHHVKANGVRCKSPAMREQPFCFFHEKFYNPPYDDSFPPLEDANSVQCAILQVLNGLKSKLITPLEARVYLYGLKAASINSRKTNFEPIQEQVTEYPTGRRPEPALPGLEEYRNLAGVPMPPSATVAPPTAAVVSAPALEREGHGFSRDEKQLTEIPTASSASPSSSNNLNCHPERSEGSAVALRPEVAEGHRFSREKKEPAAIRTARSASSTTSALDQQLATSN